MEFRQFFNPLHAALAAEGAIFNIDTGHLQHQLPGIFRSRLVEIGRQPKQTAILANKLLFAAVGQKTEMTDTHKILRYYVQQKTAHKLVCRHARLLEPMIIVAVAIRKNDAAVVSGDDPVIGDRQRGGCSGPDSLAPSSVHQRAV